MSLNDRVAQQIMGEIDSITKQIDGQVELLAATTRETRKSAALIREAVHIAQLEAIATTEKLIAATATQEMQKAGDATLKALSETVGRIAQQLAGDAAAAEKANAISFATRWVTVGVIACSVVFFGLGYGVRMLSDEINLNTAREKVSEANALAESAQAKAESDIAAFRQSMGWLGSQEGQLAKRFFDSGAGAIAANCNQPTWEMVQGSDGKYCIPKRRDLFGGEKERYGWKIP